MKRPQKQGIIFGTPNFTNLQAVERYYGKVEARLALTEGRALVGRPELQKGDKLYLIRGEGRYQIERCS